jgi:hypothetical protein
VGHIEPYPIVMLIFTSMVRKDGKGLSMHSIGEGYDRFERGSCMEAVGWK